MTIEWGCVSRDSPSLTHVLAWGHAVRALGKPLNQQVETHLKANIRHLVCLLNHLHAQKSFVVGGMFSGGP